MRLVKAPKLHLIDAALTAHLQGNADPAPLASFAQLGVVGVLYSRAFPGMEPCRLRFWRATE